MSNRKESLKKSLGITEYPWSSDDDDNDTTPTIPVAPQRRPTESQINNNNLSEMAGSSAQSHVASTQSTSRRDRDQARQDRDFFWSLLNKPRGSTVSLPRTSSRPDVPLSYLVSSRPTSHGSGLALPLSLVSRPGHSAVDARASPDLSSPSAVLRFLNLRKFNRSHRPSRSTTNMYPTVSGSAGRVFSVPEAQSRSASASDVTELIRSRSRRNQSRNGIQESGRNISLNDSSTEEAPASPSILRNPATSGEIDLSARSTVEPVHIDQSDDEADVTAPSVPPPTARDEDMVDGDAVAEVHVTLSPEEEVVEIDAEPETIVVGDVSTVNIQDGEDHALNEETPQASTAAEEGQQQPHGVKRKRDAVEDNEPHSVKEFNQSLLRLLECPVCLEWMEPPMSQCRRGHLVCGRCRARLATCPVCRTAFSSVRNRAMEGVAEMLRYPCRHGCGREVRLRRRTPHEASCAARRYRCPAPACAERAPLPHHDLAKHFQSKHLPLLKIGRKHKFSLKVNAEQHDNWLIMALQELFHLRIDVDIRTWGVIVYVAYIGPKCMAKNYTYEVTCVSQHNSRKLVYTRATHCDLESSSLNVSRQDCFHLTLDQALNFLRVKNRYCEPDKFLNFTVDITKLEVDASRDDSDS